MKKIIIVLPLYNDWKSANKLIEKIHTNLKKKFIIHIIIVNDCSSEKISVKIKKFSSIKKINIINLKRNIGSQKAIYVGLKKIKNKNDSIIVVMDSDGEDDASKLNELISKARSNPDAIVFAKRSKRTENYLLKLLNNIRLLVNFFLIGTFLNIGNFSAFSSKNLTKLLSNKNLALAYSSGAIKNIKKNYFLDIDKKKRFFGFTKVNFYFLIIHSFNIISIFYKQVFFRTSIIFFICLKIESLENYILIISFFYLLINICLIFNFFLNSRSKFDTKIIKSIDEIY